MELERIIIFSELDGGEDGKTQFVAMPVTKNHCKVCGGYIVGYFDDYRITSKKYDNAWIIYERKVGGESGDI